MSQVYGKIFAENLLSPSHLKLIELTGNNKTVLELGASTGYMTKEFLENNCIVDVIEIDKDDLRKATKFARRGWSIDLDTSDLKEIKSTYDVIVAADVLEHLKNPDEVIKKLKTKLKKNGTLLISMPNIACWQIRKDLFFRGQFEYQEWGILDKTHLHFYTFNNLPLALKKIGFKKIVMHQMENDYPLQLTIMRFGKLGKVFDKTIGRWLIKKFPNLCTWHMIAEAKI